MDQPVDQGGDDGVASEDFSPGTEGTIGGDDDAPVLVAQADDLEEEVGCLAATSSGLISSSFVRYVLF